VTGLPFVWADDQLLRGQCKASAETAAQATAVAGRITKRGRSYGTAQLRLRAYEQVSDR
jgi:hypothetical protein